MSSLHHHCQTCIKVNRNGINSKCSSTVCPRVTTINNNKQTTRSNHDLPPPIGDSNDVDHCPIISCDNHSCPFRMHACKLIDHKSICLFQRVECVNHFYGCNAMLTRGTMSSHLPQCPASVVYCSVEWIRWPDRSRPRKDDQVEEENATLKKENETDLLDVALALRDERRLEKKLKQLESKKKCNISGAIQKKELKTNVRTLN
jgi:TRAF-like zinc-finger